MTLHPQPTDFAPPQPARPAWWRYLLVATVSLGTGLAIGLQEASGPVPASSEGPPHPDSAFCAFIDSTLEYMSGHPTDEAVVGLDADPYFRAVADACQGVSQR